LPEAAAALAAAFRRELPDVEFRGCDRPAQVCEGAGVVVSAITMSEKVMPPLSAGLLEPGALAVALDYDAAWSSAAMAECDRFVTDDTAQVLATKAAGVRLAGIPARIHADLGECAAGVKVGRERPDERIFCMNLGVAIEDVAVGGLAYRRALESGRGRRLPL
jgi:ornithine cyclodeaminase